MELRGDTTFGGVFICNGWRTRDCSTGLLALPGAVSALSAAWQLLSPPQKAQTMLVQCLGPPACQAVRRHHQLDIGICTAT